MGLAAEDLGGQEQVGRQLSARPKTEVHVTASAIRILQIDVPSAFVDDCVTFWASMLSAQPAHAPGGFIHLHHATAALEVHVQPIGGDDPRYHIDIQTADRLSAAAAAVRAGALMVETSNSGYTVLTDPAGLAFCLVDPGSAAATPVAGRIGARGFLEEIIVRVPSDVVDAERDFWTSILNADQTEGDLGREALAGIRSTTGNSMTLCVTQARSRPAIHVGLSTTDVEAEMHRITGLGAVLVDPASSSARMLADPAGNVFCVVPTPRSSQ